MRKQIIQLLGNTEKSYYRWKEEGRPIISFLEKYFTQEDLQEFLNTGSIQSLETQNQSQEKIRSYENLLIDNALYSVKIKLSKLFKDNFIDATIYTKGAKGILIDVLNLIDENDTTYTLDNSKQRLLDQIMSHEVHWLSLKNPAKQKLLSSFINKYLSNIEVYAMIKNSKESFNY